MKLLIVIFYDDRRSGVLRQILLPHTRRGSLHGTIGLEDMAHGLGQVRETSSALKREEQVISPSTASG